MNPYDLSSVPDDVLLRDTPTCTGNERGAIAMSVAHIAEVDQRKLYLPAGYPSMYSYCVFKLHYSEDAAYKRIHAGRTARRHPEIFPALADGRLHLSGVVLLGPHLTSGNAAELLGAAEWKRKAEIEQLIAERFPRTELLPMVSDVPVVSPQRDAQLAPGQVDGSPGDDPAPAMNPAPLPIATPAPPPRVTPIAAERVGWQFSSGRALHDKFRCAQELMNCTDIEQVLGAAIF